MSWTGSTCRARGGVDNDGAWTGGNFTAALVLDENASEEQRAALAQIYGGELGGDAANLAALIGDMKGVFTAPIEYSATAGEVSFKAADTAQGAGRRTSMARRKSR